MGLPCPVGSLRLHRPLPSTHRSLSARTRPCSTSPRFTFSTSWRPRRLSSCQRRPTRPSSTFLMSRSSWCLPLRRHLQPPSSLWLLMRRHPAVAAARARLWSLGAKAHVSRPGLGVPSSTPLTKSSSSKLSRMRSPLLFQAEGHGGTAQHPHQNEGAPCSGRPEEDGCCRRPRLRLHLGGVCGATR